MEQKKRAAFYIDGYNLYNGLRESGLYKSIWLDLEWLCKRLLIKWTDKQEQLVRIKYFTAIPNHFPDRALRHKTYLSALKAKCPSTEIVVGNFARTEIECSICNRPTPRWNEKQTDVAISVNLLKDAYDDLFDSAYLVTADTDQLPAIRILKQVFPDKKIGMFFPPGRYLGFLHENSDFGEEIAALDIRKCQFDEVITLDSGVRIEKPRKWK